MIGERQRDAEGLSLKAAVRNDYTIAPDIVVVRGLEPSEGINAFRESVESDISLHGSLRESNSGLPILHASTPCKWAMRSDRGQNARSEALHLIRNRMGRMPHVVLVTSEPTPSRLSPPALGAGDVDCVYHFALLERVSAFKQLGHSDTRKQLRIMIKGHRLGDISNLPLELAV